MSKGGDLRATKAKFLEEFRGLVDTYKSVLIATLDNVGSKHMQKLRMSMRGLAIIRIGKNTTIRYALREMIGDLPHVEPLINLMRGNIALVFTNGDLKVVRDMLIANRVKAPAKRGAFSPIEVVVPAGMSGLDSPKTSFFQALGIPTKITKGQVEITSSFTVLKPGQKVSASDAVLLNMLGISPFTYGINVLQVFSEGSTFVPERLDIDDETLATKIQEGIRNVAAFSLAVGVPTAASVPHTLINGYKNILAVAIATGVTFPLAEKVLDRINNPGAYASASIAAAPAASAAGKAAASKPAAAVQESEEEGDDDFGLFD